MPTKKKSRAKRKPAAPDWAAVAADVEPNSLPRQAVLTSLLVGAASEVDRLVELAHVGELNAAGSRALTEARRLIARLTGTLGTGSTPRVVAPDDDGPIPLFCTFDDTEEEVVAQVRAQLAEHRARGASPVADDADLDGQLAQSFGGTDDE